MACAGGRAQGEDYQPLARPEELSQVETWGNPVTRIVRRKAAISVS